MHRHLPPAVMAAALVAAATLGCSNETPAQASSVSALRSSTAAPPTLRPQASHTPNGLIAVSPVNSRVVWVSGRGGTYAVTTDSGNTWRPGVVPGAETLQFRDVEGVSDKVAYLMSIGTGTDSRVYKTVNSGATWSLQFTNQDPDGFYDCFAFWTSKRGILFGDSVKGRFPARRTTDGRTWIDIGNKLPPALPGEGGFASSGTCVATQGEKRAWIATGAGERARILATGDGGESWAAHDTPLRGSPSAGIFSVEFRDGSHGIIGGGDLDPAAPPFDNVARSGDGGKTWRTTARAPIGTVYGLAYARDRGDDDESDRSSGQGASRAKVVVTGPGGAAWSSNEGDSWETLAGVSGFWAVAFANERTGWLVGTEGRILKISFEGGD
jgi:photosystem II stability/assembly factor-like uncharacterized protein